MRETVTARWQHYLVSLWRATIGMCMTVKTEQPLQDGGAPEYAYHDRTAWRCAVFVGKSYGSKGYPQRNAVHVRWTMHVTSSSPLKQHLSGERFPDDDAVEKVVCAWFRQQPQEFYTAGFQGLVKWWNKCLNLFGDYFENKCCLYVIITIRLFSITICNLLIDFLS